MMGRIDIDDMVVSPFFVIASCIAVGLFPGTIMGVDFASNLIDFGNNAGLSIANIVAITSIGVVIASNEPDLSAMSGVETWVAIATIGLVLTPPFAPALETFLSSSDIIGILSVSVQSGGLYSLSYLG